MLRRLKQLIKENDFDDIYFIGVIDDSDEIKEMVKDTNFLYLEFGDFYIKIEAIEGYGKLSIKIFNELNYESSSDEIIGKVKVEDIIFTNPLATNRISSIGFVNLEEYETVLICDVLYLKMENGQELFIDPGFCGINIGGLEQRKFWKENQILHHKNKFNIKEVDINIF
ncbi:TPA: hypothetical protein PTV44_000032 [Clostridium botulinum]|nr:hypothetical protein [Clostridium botulinum]